MQLSSFAFILLVLFLSSVGCTGHDSLSDHTDVTSTYAQSPSLFALPTPSDLPASGQRHLPTAPKRLHRIPCTVAGCPNTFKSLRGRVYHIRSIHEVENAHQLERRDLQPQAEPTPDQHFDFPLNQYPPALPEPSAARLPGPSVPGVPPRLAQKIHHPYLTGSLYFMS